MIVMTGMVGSLITEVSSMPHACRWEVAPLVFLTCAIALLLPGSADTAPAAPGPTEGTIASVEAGAVTVTTRGGTQVRVLVTPDTTIIQRKPVTLENIKPNDFIGVTARRETDGSLTAISINIFPPEFKDRVRQAQFVMETGNIMTNATVFQNVRRVEGRTLYLKLGDGSVIIAVPKDAAVLRLTLAKASDLRPGMAVLVRGTQGPDGNLTATTITLDAR
jgi:hypothetical protein